MSHEQWIILTAALAAVASALLAAAALVHNARQSRMLTTMAHLRAVTEKLHAVRIADRDDAEKAILAFYSGSTDDLPAEGRHMLALLDELDLTVVGIEESAVNRKVAVRWIRTIIGHDRTVRKEFLKEFQECCGDAEIYDQVERLIDSVEGKNVRQRQITEVAGTEQAAKQTDSKSEEAQSRPTDSGTRSP